MICNSQVCSPLLQNIRLGWKWSMSMSQHFLDICRIKVFWCHDHKVNSNLIFFVTYQWPIKLERYISIDWKCLPMICNSQVSSPLLQNIRLDLKWSMSMSQHFLDICRIKVFWCHDHKTNSNMIFFVTHQWPNKLECYITIGWKCLLIRCMLTLTPKHTIGLKMKYVNVATVLRHLPN